MAKVGLNSFRYAIATIAADGTVTYGGAQTPGRAINYSFTPTVSDASLYSDDVRSEYDNTVTGGDVSLGIDREDADTMCALLGHTKSTEGLITDNVNDTAPYVATGRIVNLMQEGVRKYRAVMLCLVKFQEPNEEDETKGESVNFGTYTLEGKMTVPQNGVWRKRQVFDTHEAALTALEGWMT